MFARIDLHVRKADFAAEVRAGYREGPAPVWGSAALPRGVPFVVQPLRGSWGVRPKAWCGFREKETRPEKSNPPGGLLAKLAWPGLGGHARLFPFL